MRAGPQPKMGTTKHTQHTKIISVVEGLARPGRLAPPGMVVAGLSFVSKRKIEKRSGKGACRNGSNDEEIVEKNIKTNR